MTARRFSVGPQLAQVVLVTTTPIRRWLLCASVGALPACDEAPPPDQLITKHCGDADFAAQNQTLCFGGCKDPDVRQTPACVPCVALPGDPLCGGEVGTSTSGAETDELSTGGESTAQTETSSRDTETGSTTSDTDPFGSTTGSPPFCGDDNLDRDEECDDGNNVDGDGCESDCTLPTVASPITILSSDAAYSCGTTDDQLKCWGTRQPVTGSPFMGGSPAAASFGILDIGGSVVELSAGFNHACARLSGGNIRCWGLSTLGALGYGNLLPIGDDEEPSAAGDVDIGGNALQVVAGGTHSCALLVGGAVRCWGGGEFGGTGLGSIDDIGDDELPSSTAPIDIGGAATVVGMGIDLACALRDDGNLFCWGLNSFGALGYGHSDIVGDNETPLSQGPVDVGGTIVELAVGGQGVCVRLDDNAIRCWGRNDGGELGYGHTNSIGDDELPSSAGNIAVGGGTVVQISKGHWSTCVRFDSGDIKCWGRGDSGQLGQVGVETIGDDETPDSIGMIDVGGPVAHVEAGRDFNCALLLNGAVRCWGVASALGYGNNEDIGDDETPASAGDVVVF